MKNLNQLSKYMKTKETEEKEWKALKSHYEGIVVYSNDITKANLDHRTITYTWKKKAYNVVDRV